MLLDINISRRDCKVIFRRSVYAEIHNNQDNKICESTPQCIHNST